MEARGRVWPRPVGIALYLSVGLFAIRESNRAVFESSMTVVGVSLAAVAGLQFFRDIAAPGLLQGLALGLAWLVISVLVDLPVFLGVFHMPLSHYAGDIALTYLAFPVITVIIALAQSRGAAAKAGL